MPATKRASAGKRYGNKRTLASAGCVADRANTSAVVEAEVLRLTLGLTREATDALAKAAAVSGEPCSRIVARAIDEHFLISTGARQRANG